MRRLWIFLVAACVSCQRTPESEVRQLVERYNRVVSEAYRRGDVRLIDPVVGPKEGKKLTGLIGVRLDMGLTLDSRLLSLEVTRVESSRDEMRVETQERWLYRDLQIGTGKQSGEESLDTYGMRYVFIKSNQDWVVDEIQFTTPPQVGRKATTWAAERRTLHGMAPALESKEEQKP